MDKKPLPPFEFRRKIATAFHLKIVKQIMEETGQSKQECLWLILTKGIVEEGKKLKCSRN